MNEPLKHAVKKAINQHDQAVLERMQEVKNKGGTTTEMQMAGKNLAFRLKDNLVGVLQMLTGDLSLTVTISDTYKRELD